jgi:DNA-binding response OmpR family regulator
MAQEALTVSNIVLFGLWDTLTAELERVLAQEPGVKVYIHRSVAGSHPLKLLKALHADVVFCAAEPDCWGPLLEAMRQQQMNLPVIVVSRAAETAQWLGALEAGARDYCAPPFEAVQIRWLLKAAVTPRRSAA